MNTNMLTLSLEYEVGFTCIGVPMPEYETISIKVPFSDEEIETMKKLVSSSTFDKEAGLMPVLEQGAPEFYTRIDEIAKNALHNLMRKKELDTISIFCDEESDVVEVLPQTEEVYDIPYFCHIPDGWKKGY